MASTQLFSNGCWTWFNEPSAIYSSVYGATFFGFMAGSDVRMGKYHHAGRVHDEFVLASAFESDDHDNPGICLLDDGKLLACYSKHASNSYVRRSTAAGDIRAWESQQTVGSTDETYAHVFQMGDTAKTIYWFYRKPDGTGYPDYFRTTTNGTWPLSWSAGTKLIANGTNYVYFHVCQSSSTRLDFVFTSIFPGTGAGSLYHFCMTVDADGTRHYYKSDGTLIGHDADLPIGPSSATLVYDGSTNRCWDWGIAQCNGTLQIAFAVFTSTTAHEYHRAQWSGSAWSTEKICDAGTTATSDSIYPTGGDPQPYYSAGMCLDLNDANTVYCAREYGAGNFQLEKWVKSGTWSGTAVSGDTSNVNGRPVVALGRNPTSLLYWRGTYTSYTSYSTAIEIDPAVTLRTTKDAAPQQNSDFAPTGTQHYYLIYEGTGTTVHDLAGAVDGAFVSTPTWGSDALGAYLSGFSTTKYVTMDSVASAFGSASAPRWVAILFSNSGTGEQWPISIGANQVSGGPYVSILLNNGSAGTLKSYWVGDGGTAATPGGTATVNDGNVHCVLATEEDATHHRVYFDGALVGSDITSNPGVMTMTKATLGCLRRQSNAYAFGGNLYAAIVGWGTIPDPVGLYDDLSRGQFAGTFSTTSSRRRRFLASCGA
jgi:hypothetical protein